MVLAGRGGTPLYDGIGFPDQPYRYAQPPHGYHQPYAPTTARIPVPLSNGTNPQEGLISSGESGPQVAIYLPPHAVRADAALSTVLVVAKPVRDKRPPADGRENSNVYALSFDPAGPTVRPGLGNNANVSLREAVFETVLPVMEFRSSEHLPWTRLTTSQVGRDIYLAPFSGSGEYVLVQPGAGTQHSSRNSGLHTQMLLILSFCAITVAGALFAVRRWGARPYSAS